MGAKDDRGEDAEDDQDVRKLTRELVAHLRSWTVTGRQAGSRMSWR
ncbi:hypothetical protein ABZY44_27030 [Streptomyces sp. NPDC006544]